MIKDTLIRVRVSKIEKEKYMKLANKKGISLSDLIREVLNKVLLESECR